MATVSKLQIVLEATTTAFDRGLKSATHQLEGFAKKTGEIHDRIDKFNRHHQKTLQLMRSIGAVSAAALGTMAYGIKGAVDEAMKFESAMAEVRKVADFPTPQGLKDFKNELIAMSGRMPIAFDGLANIAAAAAQAGIPLEDLTRHTETAAKMATAFGVSADVAGQSLSEMRAAFQMTHEQVVTLADQINYLGNSTPNAADKIMTVVQAVGSIGELANISAAEIAAMTASVVGLDASVTGTGIKNIALRLSAGTAATKQQQQAFEQLGLSAKQVATDMQKDAMGTIMTIIDRIKELPAEQQSAITKLLVGQEALPVFAQFIKNQDMLKANLREVGDEASYAGSMLAEYEAQAGTLANQIEILKNKKQNLTAAIGEAFAPAVEAVVKAIGPVIDRMTEWATQNPDLTAGIVAVIGVVSTLGVAIGAIGLAVPVVVTAFAGLTTISTALAAALGAISLPMVAIAVAIAVVIAAGVYLYKNWDMVKQKAQEVFDSLPQPVKQAIDDIKQAFDSVAGFIGSALSAVVPIVDGYIKMMTLPWRMAFEVIKATVSFGIEAIKAVFVADLTIIASLVSGTLRTISNVFSTIFAVIKALVRGDMDGVKAAISQGLQNAVTIARQGASDIWGAFKRLGADLLQAGKDAIQGLIDGIKSKITDAISTVRNMAGNIASTVRSVLDIRSPSRVMKQLGEWTALGLAKGIADKTPVVSANARQMADQIKNNVASKLAELKREIALFGNKNPVTELAYDIGQGKYGSNTDQLTKLNQQLYVLNQTQTVLDEISAINREIKTHGMSRLEIFEWELENTDKYAGVLDEVLNEHRQILQTQAEFNKVIEQRNKTQQANQDLVQKTADLHRQIALFGNDSALAAFEHDWAAGKYTDADVAIVTAYHQALIAIDELNRKANTKSAFDNLQKNLISEDPLQKLQSQLDERLKIINDFEQAHTDVAQQAAAARAQVQQSFDQARTDLMLATYENGLGALNGIIKSAFGEQSGIYRAMFAIEKGYALARVLLSQKEALAKAWASAPFPANLPAVATTAIKTGALSAAIQTITPVIGQAHDGIMSVPKSGTWNLEKGERVLPRHTAKALDDKLDKIGNGGRPVNVVINNYSGENATTQQMPNGDVMVTIGKQMGLMMDSKLAEYDRKRKRQGWG